MENQNEKQKLQVRIQSSLQHLHKHICQNVEQGDFYRLDEKLKLLQKAIIRIQRI